MPVLSESEREKILNEFAEKAAAEIRRLESNDRRGPSPYGIGTPADMDWHTDQQRQRQPVTVQDLAKVDGDIDNIATQLRPLYRNYSANAKKIERLEREMNEKTARADAIRAELNQRATQDRATANADKLGAIESRIEALNQEARELHRHPSQHWQRVQAIEQEVKKLQREYEELT